MKIVLVSAVYPPEPVVSAQMGRDLALHLTSIGAAVTVLCPPPSRPMGADYSSLKPASGPLIRVEDGVQVVRVRSFTAPKSRLLPRILESLSFGYHACCYLAGHLANTDVIYANTWPMLSQTLLARYAARCKVPLVWHIKDLYPESLLRKFPRVLSTFLSTPLVGLDRWIAQQASHTVVLSESIRRVYIESRHLPKERVSTVLDWIDESRFAKSPPRSQACAQYQVAEDRFTFLYLGNIGPVAGVELLIEAFHAARIPRAQLIIAGEGSAKAGCMALTMRLGTSGVKFISDPDVDNVPLLQALAHVCLLPLRKGAGTSSIPSKVMAYLLSGRPILAAVDLESDTARLLHEAQCGWVGNPEDVGWLAARMREIAAMPAVELGVMGERGRAYGLANYSKCAGVKKLAAVITAAASLKAEPQVCPAP